MNEEKAKEILYSSSYEGYVDWDDLDSTILIDGRFALQELEAIIFLFRNKLNERNNKRRFR